jgi:hypothetical protein
MARSWYSRSTTHLVVPITTCSTARGFGFQTRSCFASMLIMVPTAVLLLLHPTSPPREWPVPPRPTGSEAGKKNVKLLPDPGLVSCLACLSNKTYFGKPKTPYCLLMPFQKGRLGPELDHRPCL